MIPFHTPSKPVYPDTKWSGVIRLTGDVCIPSGVTLTIQPGTEVIVAANQDDQQGGFDPDKVEIIVEGELIAGDPSGSPVMFHSSLGGSAANTDWGGIRVEPGGQATITNSQIRDAVWGIEVRMNTSSVEIAESDLTHCVTAIHAALSKAT